MLYVPFAIFLLNSSFVHIQAIDKVFTSKDVCMKEVADAIAKATEKAPEGGKIVGGCLPLPEGSKAPVIDPNKSTDPSGHFYDPIHPERNLEKYTTL